MTIPETLLVRSGLQAQRVEYRAGETILETLRRAGIDLSTQCEQGYCGTCMVQLLQGEIKMRINDALSEADVEDGMRLGCQGVPKGDVVEIELF